MPSSPESPLLAAEKLARRHPSGQQWLLDGVSLAVARGERLALLGPSGSGKTLLLRALAMLDPVDSGRILWHGQPVPRTEIPRFRCSAIYLHQRAALGADTVDDALRLPLDLAVHRGREFAREAIVGWLAELGRDEWFLDKRASELSGGEIQITALLRALQLEPQVLLLDEPTSALDVHTARGVERLIEHWTALGHAAIWVTHDSAQANRVATRALHIAGGRIASE